MFCLSMLPLSSSVGANWQILNMWRMTENRYLRLGVCACPWFLGIILPVLTVGRKQKMCPGWYFVLPHFHSVLWALQQDQCAGFWCLCVNNLPRPKDTGTNFENKFHCIPSRGLIPYLFPSCSLAWFCMLICYILFLPNKKPFLEADVHMCLSADLYKAF